MKRYLKYVLSLMWTVMILTLVVFASKAVIEPRTMHAGERSAKLFGFEFEVIENQTKLELEACYKFEFQGIEAEAIVTPITSVCPKPESFSMKLKLNQGKYWTPSDVMVRAETDLLIHRGLVGIVFSELIMFLAGAWLIKLGIDRLNKKFSS